MRGHGRFKKRVLNCDSVDRNSDDLRPVLHWCESYAKSTFFRPSDSDNETFIIILLSLEMRGMKKTVTDPPMRHLR